MDTERKITIPGLLLLSRFKTSYMTLLKMCRKENIIRYTKKKMLLLLRKRKGGNNLHIYI